MMENILFGVMPDGTPVEQYALRAGALSCEIITYGGALRALRVPDRNGNPVDVLLGFDRLEDYRNQDKYLGALVGRVANRIGGKPVVMNGQEYKVPSFPLNGREYPLAANNGPNHLHGGLEGFDKKVWTVAEAGESCLKRTLKSPHQQENYPGNLAVRVTYALSEDGLKISYFAQSDQDTLCNLTSHAYFNLSGHASGTVLGQTIQIFADQYTPTDAASIPTGALEDVAGTPMDLRTPKAIGAEIGADFVQLVQAGGYDHNWVLRGKTGILHPAARAVSPETGIVLDVETTLPGVQFYAGNYLDGCPAGKDGVAYDKRWGFCLETQFFPDAPNKPQFENCLLRAGETWEHTTVFRFSAES